MLNFQRSVPGVWLFIATLVNCVWAVVSVAAAYDPALIHYASLIETLRSGAWIAFLISLLLQYWRVSEQMNYAFFLSIAIWFIFGFLLLIDGLVIGGWLDLQTENTHSIIGYFLFGRLVSTIGTLALLENLYRNTPHNDQWSIRPVSIALAAILIFDIYLYTEGALFRGVNADLFDARGAVQALCMPLIAMTSMRNTTWKVELQLSRKVVFHTVSLLVTGVYLVAMSLAGLYLRRFGGNWGNVLQITFLFLTVVAFVIFVMSGTVRAFFRVLLQKHFFLHKYDYREEWLRFIKTVSGSGQSDDLERRVIEASCDILDAPAGELWLRDEDGYFVPARSWNFVASGTFRESSDSALIKFMTLHQWVINLNEMRQGDPKAEYAGVGLPQFAQLDSRLWLLMPLFHHENLLGFISVVQPRVPRSLNWEDHDLLKTIGRQAASYIAERQSQEALSRVAEFEAFNRRFAFIIHDLKNLVSQLALLSRNAQKHMDNPEFREDMLSTLNASVEKMNKMLSALNQQVEGQKNLQTLNIVSLLTHIMATRKNAFPNLEFSVPETPLWATADGDQLEQVFLHLIQNAADATTDGSPIVVAAQKTDGWAQVNIRDTGCGMSEEFVKKELFRPFRSTKANGFGIGAYECRELLKIMGGRIDVKSCLGEGTDVSVLLPIGPEPSENT